MKCLSPARARTRTARSTDERTNNEATSPPTMGLQMGLQFIFVTHRRSSSVSVVTIVGFFSQNFLCSLSFNVFRVFLSILYPICMSSSLLYFSPYVKKLKDVYVNIYSNVVL